MVKKIPYSLLIIVICLIWFCGDSKTRQADIDYVKNIEDWHKKRVSDLKTENGWLSLIGLFWLEEGENTMGSADSNDFMVEVDTMPAKVGSFHFKEDVVVFKTDQEVQHKGELVRELIMKDDSNKDYSLLEFDSFTWYIIKRGPKYGVRLKNNKDPKIAAMKDIEMFKIDSEWAVKAKYIKFEQAKIIKVLDAIGQVTDSQVPGKLVFKKNGKTFELLPFGEGKRGFFLVFGDQTNTHETYGGGRFLSIQKPDENNETIIDFNKAYNPPCVFSAYATCPIPARENRLPIRVTAGEKMYGDSH